MSGTLVATLSRSPTGIERHSQRHTRAHTDTTICPFSTLLNHFRLPQLQRAGREASTACRWWPFVGGPTRGKSGSPAPLLLWLVVAWPFSRRVAGSRSQFFRSTKIDCAGPLLYRPTNESNVCLCVVVQPLGAAHRLSRGAQRRRQEEEEEEEEDDD